MGNKHLSFLLLITAFLGGFVLMSIELVYPRISIIWFGNVLTVWAIDLSMSLIVIAIGYWLGSRLLLRKKREAPDYLLFIYLITAIYLLIINLTHQIVLKKVSNLDVTSGAILFSILFMFPTMGLLAVSGPLLVHLKNTVTQKNAFGSSIIFGVSTMGGAIAMLVIGLYCLPYIGISTTIYCLITILLINTLLILRFKHTR